MPDKNLAKTETESETETETSDFGSGFLYPLALFLAHEWNLQSKLDYYKQASARTPGDTLGLSPEHAASLVMNGAGDHLYEFDLSLAPESLRERCTALRDNALRLRLEKPKKASEVADLFIEAKDIFFELDRLNGAKPVRAEWS